MAKRDPKWQPVAGRLSMAAGLEEYERIKAQLPPGVEVTRDMMRPWLNEQLGQTAPRQARTTAPKPRAPGRPGWTQRLFDDRYREAVKATALPHTTPSIAANFRSLRALEPFGVEPDTLAALIRRRARGEMPPD